MKLTIAKEQLLTGLQAVQNVVGSRTTLPILSNVLLRAVSSRLELTATDLDVTIACSVPANVEGEGAVTLPVKKLFGLVRELVASEVELEVDDKSVASLRSGASFFKINGLAAEDFPPLPTFKQSRAVTLPQEKLKAMLRRTAFAVSSDESRYVLNGIFFSLKDHKFTLVATDGRRLAMSDEEVEVPAESFGEFIVPTKAINELNRLLATGNVELMFSENQVGFTLQPASEGGLGVYVVSKLVDGNYPNYRQVIPQGVQERVAIPREEFLQCLRRAEIMTNDKQNSVKLSFGKNQLAITANTPEVGEARDVLSVNYKGRDMSIAFNPGYLMDPLRALDNDEIFFELIDELSPGVIKCSEPFLYVIMPMRMS
ncbi:MAG: DNA polymerase III subunit beta [Verrucomicrobiota bacterium]